MGFGCLSKTSRDFDLAFDIQKHCSFRFSNHNVKPKMNVTQHYLHQARGLIDIVSAQETAIQQAAKWFAEAILADRVVHLFGAGHSRMMVEEMWPRYGSFPGFHPIVELSITFHNGVVGTGGQRQAMFLENTPGLADRILRNYTLNKQDAALIVSSSGCNVVAIEMAKGFQKHGIRVVALISQRHSKLSMSQHSSGKKLPDWADLILDTGAPAGDALISIKGLDLPVSPGSTLGGCLIVNAIKAEVAEQLVKAGKPPKVLTAAALVGKKRASELFEAAYDEHAARLRGLYQFDEKQMG